MTITLRSFGEADYDWLVDLHGRLYAKDEGFDETFGALVAEILREFLQNHDPACERGFVAVNETGERLGSIFCVRLDAETAKLRLFLLTSEARGHGLGKHLLDACTGFARQAGYARMKLWTHESHRAACALYARNGWTLHSSKPVRSFGQSLVEQHWSRPL
ncbi:Acetyltransferase (GNAT) family protein [Roseivivax halotolerans]|uniref:Acetyltransferase (GNAT) family protein n=1 Tax=Roseivivax halotolerans TaxID=93684 RepID=A0A1I5XYN6_9RHOB|nr:GNAT family N-acetyltransferase [Roseivivax halotolerans]SFQ37091.1 Acetyltransferase (GNAT) family protein [Roseivivax halotolerans]